MKKYSFILTTLLLFFCSILSSCSDNDNGTEVTKERLNGLWVATEVDVIHTSCGISATGSYESIETFTKESEIAEVVGEFTRFYFADNYFCYCCHRTSHFVTEIPLAALSYEIKKDNYLIFENKWGDFYPDRKIKIADLKDTEMVIKINEGGVCSKDCATIIKYKRGNDIYQIPKDYLIGRWRPYDIFIVDNDGRWSTLGYYTPDSELKKYGDLFNFKEIEFTESSLITSTGKSYPYTIINNYLSTDAYSGTAHITESHITEYGGGYFVIHFRPENGDYNAFFCYR